MIAKVSVIGPDAPPITGERVCKQLLLENLGEFRRVQSSQNNSAWFLHIRKCDYLWVFVGASALGFIRDLLNLLMYIAIKKPDNVIMNIHNQSWRYFCKYSWFLKYILANCLFLVLSEKVKSCLESKGYKARVFNNTISKGRNLEFNRKERQGSKRLIWLSAVSKDKGFDTAVEIFKCLKIRSDDWIFDIYGARDSDLVEGTIPGLTFHGFIDGVEKFEAIDRGGVFLLPSRYPNENQPLAIIEALALGIPVVASNIGGIPEMLLDNKAKAGAALKLDASLEDYIEAIEDVLSKYSSYSTNAIKIFEAKYSLGAYQKELNNLLD